MPRTSVDRVMDVRPNVPRVMFVTWRTTDLRYVSVSGAQARTALASDLRACLRAGCPAVAGLHGLDARSVPWR